MSTTRSMSGRLADRNADMPSHHENNEQIYSSTETTQQGSIFNPAELNMIKSIRDSVPSFNGSISNMYLLHDFISKLDKHFLVSGSVNKTIAVLFVTSKFTGYASVWYENHHATFKEDSPRLINDWQSMKRELKRVFIPPENERQVYNKLSTIKQGSKSVIEYLEQFQKLLALVPETRIQDQFRYYIEGLDPEIQKGITNISQSMLSLDELITASIRQEFALKNVAKIMAKSANTQNAEANKNKRKEQNSTTNRGKPAEKDLKDIICNLCKKNGHYDRRCPMVNDFMASVKSTNYASAKTAITTKSHNCQQNDKYINFILDSGCTQHMVPIHYKLICPNKVNQKINIASSGYLYGQEEGIIFGYMNNVPIALTNVLRVSGLSDALLSVSALAKEGYGVNFEKNGKFQITNDEKSLEIKGERKNNVYAVQLQIGKEDEGQAMKAVAGSYTEWHQKLGHISEKKITMLFPHLKRDRKSTRLNSSHPSISRMPSSA